MVTLSNVLTACSVTNSAPPATAVIDQPSTVSTALAFQGDNQFGKSLSDADRQSLGTAEQRALDYGKVGEVIDWKGDTENVSGTVIAYQPFRVGQTNCRRFEHKLNGASGSATTNGTACQRKSGDWRLVR